MTGCLLDDPMFLVEGKERKEKVNKVFSDVEQLQKESKMSDRYMTLYSSQFVHIHEAQPYQGPVLTQYLPLQSSMS